MELVESIYSSDFLCAINILQFSVHKIHDKAIIYFKKNCHERKSLLCKTRLECTMGRNYYERK